MSASLPDDRARADEAAPAAPDRVPRHVHDWQGYTFGFDGVHALAEQTCACGATRSIRAWEAHWEPGGPPMPHPARRVAIPRENTGR